MAWRPAGRKSIPPPAQRRALHGSVAAGTLHSSCVQGFLFLVMFVFSLGSVMAAPQDEQ